MRGLAGAFAFGLVVAQPAQAQTTSFEATFDSALGTETRAPRTFEAVYETGFKQQIARLADGSNGRIGVAVLDLATGQEFSILGDQRFPMASTSKIAVAATFMEGVEQGRWSLSSEFPLLIPARSEPFSSVKAPVRKGKYLPASQLIELMITRSSNPATDALLAAVGGPEAVNDWMRRAGIEEFQLTRDIATLVRDDGEIDPATAIDIRDSATPRAMTQLLAGLYQGRWLSKRSREVILGAMERCITGKRRIPALLPAGVTVAHKTGSLNNTSSDIGIVRTPGGQAFAVAIYVTGQGTRPARENRIAQIARAVYSGYDDPQGITWAQATYGSGEAAAKALP
ncbi:class A beta-lactamase [Pelagerythrobacter rhizovicinus]|uniref:beta-lactamase n=1 Tax=Pelagerythrobacter rhizovicinus TaxID=2268576 RepID=A0A4Q2KL53_9SPHN|nr:class A beta-lactamase [Pelagerythrobacter rhizovicinus]RXZ64940.1 class A beta-lactamase [Pelagerythrobacter rhizovicinus]